MSGFILSAFADEYSVNIDEQINWLCANDVPKLEIRGVDGTPVADIPDTKAKEVSKKIKSSGITLSAVGSPVGKISIRDDFRPHFEKFKYIGEIANILEAERIRIFSFYLDREDSYSDVRNEVIERLGVLSEYAGKQGLILCHENEKGIYGNTAERCLDIVENLPAIKCVFDPANFVCDGNQDCLAAFELLKEHVLYMHIKDSDSDGTMVVAGEGDGKIPEILGRLSKRNEDTVLTLEPHLMEFTGLSGLEREGERSGIAGKYKNNEEAFAAALGALKKITEEL